MNSTVYKQFKIFKNVLKFGRKEISVYLKNYAL